MKKIVVIISAIMICLSLVSCSSPNNNSIEKSSSDPNSNIESKSTENNPDFKIWDEFSIEIGKLSNEFTPEFNAIMTYDGINSKTDLKEKLIQLKSISENISTKLSILEESSKNSKVKNCINIFNLITKNTIISINEFLEGIENNNITLVNSAIDNYVDANTPSMNNEINHVLISAKNDLFELDEKVPKIEKYDTTGIKSEMKNNYLSLSDNSPQKSNSKHIASHTKYNCKMKYGELIESIVNDNTLIIKAKISPSYNNKATINQNGYNVGDLIKNQGADKFNEIQYWAVADMEDGSEDKVISFTLNKDLINKIKDDSIVDNKIIDNAQEVWILPSLRR